MPEGAEGDDTGGAADEVRPGEVSSSAGVPAPTVDRRPSTAVTAAPATVELPPPAVRRESPVARFARRRATPLVFLGALAVLLPGLGYGLWDPWETHYAEVARRITVDGDWVTLHWGNADSDPAEVRKHPRPEQASQRFLFFSKPILAFWLMALSFLAFGAGEFAARLPMVLLAAGGVAGAFFYLRRLVGDRAALFSSLLLLLTPMWAMIGRHAITDMPFVAPAMVGTLAFAAVLLDERTDARHSYVGYVCLALATLAKGLLGFLLPGAALLALLFVTGELRRIRVAGTELGAGLDALGEWVRGVGRFLARRGPFPAVRGELWVWLSVAGGVALLVVGVAMAAVWRFGPASHGGALRLSDVLNPFRFASGRWGGMLAGALVAVAAVLLANGDRWKRLRLPLGVPLFLAICATWYGPVILRHGSAFVNEFFLLHHFGRASSGIGLDLTGLDVHEGTAGYYLQQLGYALFPWIVVLPAAAIAWARGESASSDRSGAPAAGGDPGPRGEPRAALFVLLVAWAAVPYVLFSISQVKFHHYIFPAIPPLAILAGVGLDRLVRRGVGRWEAAGLLLGGVFLFLAWRELVADPHRLVRLFTYRYTRRFPEFGWMRLFFGAALVLAAAGGLGALLAAWRRSRRAVDGRPGVLERAGGGWLVATTLLGSAVLTGAALWGHVPRMSRWISQQEAFAALDAERREGEALVSWANNWRGEVFYSGDQVTVIEKREDAESKLRGVLRRPGRVFFITTNVREVRDAVGRAVGAAAAREHFRVLTAERSGGFDAAVYDGPAAGTYEPRVGALPAGVGRPAGAAGGDVALLEPGRRGRLALVGSRIAPERVTPGGTVRVELYVRCDAPTSSVWEVFIHADGPPPSRKPRVGNGDHGFAGGAVATSSCRRGELLLDRWELEIAAGAATGTYQVFAGLWYPPEGHRMTVEPAAASRSPGAERGTLDGESLDRVYLGDVVVAR
ncbi:MAG: glycosyltransferase family 39 protein [Deltaproteobacteria bacterium]|nr:glycosyltransferase family 39 protein [Deltaproteobacteria bacterium]